MLVVVGGHSRNIGKTSVMAGLIAATPQARWTAIKITQYGHNLCSAAGQPCDCSSGTDHPYALSRQRAPDRTDSGRYLSAGAARSFWLRTASGELGHALPVMRRLFSLARHTIVESNSLLRFFDPDVYLMVLDYSAADIKESARRYFDRASAFVLVGSSVESRPWPGIPDRWFDHKPMFRVAAPVYRSAELAEWFSSKLEAGR
jgi:hypothetical protein